MQRAHPDPSRVPRHIWCLGIVLAALQLTGCGPAEVPAQRPRGIVSLNPCTDAILAKVAAPAQIKALSAYSRNPNSSSMDVAVAKRFSSTAGTVEEIAALRPALVISGNFTPPATRQALARLNIRLVEFPITSTVGESINQVRQIAKLAGHPGRGEALIAEIESALSAAHPPDNRVIQALVWQSGGIVPGDQTLIADLLRRTGFSNAAAARGLKQADFLPLERVLTDPPAVILASGDKSGEDRMLAHPALSVLEGTQRATFESRLLWCGGPTIVEAAQRLAEVRQMVGQAK